MLLVCAPGVMAQAPSSSSPLRAPTDLDRFMAAALLRRDIDRQTLSDYVLDEVESFEVLGPGRVPFARMRYEFTWYVRDGMHVRSPVKADGVPIPESARRAYEERWIKSEEGRRKFRTEREAKRAQAGQPPAVGVPSINEPRFISESYFLDFKFEPGNYYLAGKESVDGHDVLKVDYLPTRLFNDEPSEDAEIRHDAKESKDTKESKDAKESKEKGKKVDKRSAKEQEKEKKLEDDIDRKMNKTAQVSLWVDPASHQIVKYTFDNVWMDFLPAGWLVKIDDLRASMEMGQPFPGVWLPHNLSIHAGLSLAVGPMELSYKREFSNYRKADVTSKITVPKGGAR
jgi:hypothetical protein